MPAKWLMRCVFFSFSTRSSDTDVSVQKRSQSALSSRVTVQLSASAACARTGYRQFLKLITSRRSLRRHVGRGLPGAVERLLPTSTNLVMSPPPPAHLPDPSNCPVSPTL